MAASALLSMTVSSRPVLSHDDGRDDGEGEASRIEWGLRISPVRLRYNPHNRRWVGLGSYIVNAQGACNDCHTCPSYASGGNPYAGQATLINATNYLAGGVPFGPFVSHNITPDDTGKPFGLSFDDFRLALRKGHDVKDPMGGPLQVMPWPVYANMTDHDLRAIYEFLRAIPQATPGSCSGAGEAAP
jgi:hypothetical protein